MRGQRAVWLVGMMGAGKSTLGPLLAEELGRPFVDTDAEVERASGRTIAALFAQEGETVFRALERRAIEEAAQRGAVVALGGGAISQPGVADRLAETGAIVYLRGRAETLLGRIGNARTRPLLAGLDGRARLARLRELMATREPDYARAALVVDVDEASVEVLVGTVVEGLARVEAERVRSPDACEETRRR